uniref:Tissue factor n=1 Tax=Nothobranchius kuhntae TaxID=321403 RepID=A0A1A8I0Q2_NOTKU
MEAGKTVLCMAAWMSAWSITTKGDNTVPKAESIRWVSLDFKTVLNWTVRPSDYRYTVLYALENGDWTENPDCSQMSHSECDMTMHLIPLDRFHEADIRTEALSQDYDYMDDLPHTYSSRFNPYRESNISSVEFSLKEVDMSTVSINITDPITSIHHQGKQLTIRDILKSDLKYKILYYKSGSTREREIVSDSSTATVSGLDAGQSYCFMVTAYIPSRAKAKQHGAWSKQLCKQGDTHLLQDLSPGAWAGIIFVSLTVIIITISLTVFCCRRNHQRNTTLQTPQTSTPV